MEVNPVYTVGENQETADRRFQQFKNELYELLHKYGAELFADVAEESDMMAVFDEHMGVQMRGDYRNNNTYRLSDGFCINSSDLL